MIFFICMIPKYGFLTTYQISDSDMQPIPGKATQGIPGQHRARLLFPDEYSSAAVAVEGNMINRFAEFIE